jgi:hypothetical protein
MAREPTSRPDDGAKQPETYPGFGEVRTCGNCQHFERQTKRGDGICHNGISQRIKTTAKHGCGHGFYPCVERWPLKAGPGGVR